MVSSLWFQACWPARPVMYKGKVIMYEVEKLFAVCICREHPAVLHQA